MYLFLAINHTIYFFLVNGVVMQGDGKQFEFDPNLPKQITKEKEIQHKVWEEEILNIVNFLFIESSL